MRYVRPLVQVGSTRPDDALPLAGGWGWFTHIEILSRRHTSRVASVSELTSAESAALTAPRGQIADMTFDVPRLMGIVNVTPDSFSDGGENAAPEMACQTALQMIGQGADILDIGGESTRPGAQTVAADDEIARVAPAIAAIRAKTTHPISIDTRKAAVADAALDAGASLVNDVAGFTFDAGLAPLCAKRNVPVCVMHAQGDPATMQKDPHYENVLLDVYDFLAERIETLTRQGLSRGQIIVDPGIGFGKNMTHNLALLEKISLFHSLGTPILLGASRKRFIGTLGGASEPQDRDAGSIGVALAALGQGVQIVRAHDVAGHAQAIALWRAGMAHE